MPRCFTPRRYLSVPVAGGTFPFLSLNAVTGPATGASVNLGHAFAQWQVQIEPTGSPVSFSVDFEGCLDGVNFRKVGASITTAGLTVITGQPLVAVRLHLTALSGGVNPTISGTLAGY